MTAVNQTYKTISVKVTAPLIARGVREDTLSCPVALAARRVFKKHDIMVDDEITWDGGSVALPVRVRRWIQRYDLGKFVKPMEFTVRVRRDQL